MVTPDCAEKKLLLEIQKRQAEVEPNNVTAVLFVLAPFSDFLLSSILVVSKVEGIRKVNPHKRSHDA